MKKMFFAFFLCSAILNAAEFTCTHDSIRCGKKQMRFLKQGSAHLLYGPKCYVTGLLEIGTKGGYYYFSSPGIDKKFSNPDKGFWEYSGKFPEDRQNTKMELKQNYELTPNGTIESNFTWKVSDPKNMTDTFYNLELSMTDFKGKSILFNGSEIPVPNETKFGFLYKNKVENPELVLYHWDTGRKIWIRGEGVMKIVFSAVKDKKVNIRFYPQPADGTMKLIWRLQ